MLRVRFLAVLLIAALATAPLAASAQDAPPGIDAHIEAVRTTFEVPGLAVAIVKDGRVVLARGYGVRGLEDPAPVDAHTLFGIASNSKAFTGTALALLVEDGRLSWDDRVADLLPGFRLGDAFVTRELTVQDLLVHRSGLSLGAGDLLWWPANTLSRKETVERLRHLPVANGFRTRYAYDNVLYMVAGEVVEAVSGRTWEDFVMERILQPLGMNETTTRVGDGFTRPNRARTHAPVDGAVVPVPPFDGENANPAAGMFSNVTDLARWMTVQLDSGRVAPDRRLFSPATTEALWEIVTPIPVSTFAPELAVRQPQFIGYGLGFGIRDFRGHKIVTHTGGLPGYVSQLTMMPDQRLGVVVLTNQESGAAFNAITYHVLDQYLGASGTNWLDAERAVRDRNNAETDAEDAATLSARDASAAPSLPVSAYAGTYTDPWYGAVEITRDGDGLGIRFTHTPLLVGDLVPWQHDTFMARWHDRTLRADVFVTFALHPDGSIREARLVPVSSGIDFSFDFQDLVLTPAAE